MDNKGEITAQELRSILHIELARTEKNKKRKQLRNKLLIGTQFVFLLSINIVDNIFGDNSKIYVNALNLGSTTITGIITSISMSKEIEEYKIYISSIEIILLRMEVEDPNTLFGEFLKSKEEFNFYKNAKNDRRK